MLVESASHFGRYSDVSSVSVGWSRTSSLELPLDQYSDSDALSPVTIQDYTINSTSVLSVSGGMAYALSSPREWMEYVEATEGRSGMGGYTVVRCDLNVPPQPGAGAAVSCKDEVSSKTRWKVWGENFHLDRLSSSHRLLVQRRGGVQDGDKVLNERIVKMAINESKAIMKTLLAEAEAFLLADQHMNPGKHEDGDLRHVVMVTLLWTSPLQSIGEGCDDVSFHEKVVVRGHACTCGIVSSPGAYNPDPIAASVALPMPALRTVVPSNILEQSLPSRHDSLPLAKLSSWCRFRRPFESKLTFKPEGIGEVLLVRNRKKWNDNSMNKANEGGNTTEILEGLTSNFFVVYRDGTIRTSPDGVLGGYARSLVFRCAERCGLRLDMRSPTLEDAKAGLWVEAFVTSSVRLVVPVGKILIPRYLDCDIDQERRLDVAGATAHHGSERSLDLEEIWSLSSRKAAPWSTPRWKALYTELLTCGDD